MGYFVGLILILLLSFSFAQTLKRSLLYCLPFSILSIISLLYIFGLFTILNVGVYVTAGLILAFFIVVLIITIKRRNLNIEFKSLPFILFCVIAIVQFFVLRNKYLSAWDEFSHWGTIVKQMFIFGNFGNIDMQVLFPGYPPATGVFHSFFMFLGNKFVEGYLYMSMNLLCLSLIMPIFDKLSNKVNVLNVIIIGFGFITLLNISGSIYVDIFLGLIMAYIIYTYFLSEKIDALMFINISLAGLVLCTTKEAGLGICLIALIIISIDMIIFNRKHLKEFLQKKKNYIIIILPILSILFAKISWTIYKNVFELNPAWNVSAITLSGVFNYIFNPNDFQIIVTKSFFTALFESHVVYCIILCLLLYMIPSFVSKKYKRDLTNILCVIGGFGIYVISLLILYIFTYSEYEALNLASFNRYLSTYLMAFGVLTFIRLVTYYSMMSENKIKENSKFVTIILTAIACLGIPCVSFFKVSRNLGLSQIRQSLTDFSNFSSTLEIGKDKVYYVYCDSDGYEFHLARYEAVPIEMNGGNWSLGEKRKDGDIWSLNITSEEWEKMLIEGNYTHIYLHNVDQIFIDTYGNLFESTNDITDYLKCKIIKINEKDIKIVKI